MLWGYSFNCVLAEFVLLRTSAAAVWFGPVLTLFCGTKTKTISLVLVKTWFPWFQNRTAAVLLRTTILIVYIIESFERDLLNTFQPCHSVGSTSACFSTPMWAKIQAPTPPYQWPPPLASPIPTTQLPAGTGVGHSSSSSLAWTYTTMKTDMTSHCMKDLKRRTCIWKHWKIVCAHPCIWMGWWWCLRTMQRKEKWKQQRGRGSVMKMWKRQRGRWRWRWRRRWDFVHHFNVLVDNCCTDNARNYNCFLF